jgi:hypothetical protein
MNSASALVREREETDMAWELIALLCGLGLALLAIMLSHYLS